MAQQEQEQEQKFEILIRWENCEEKYKNVLRLILEVDPPDNEIIQNYLSHDGGFSIKTPNTSINDQKIFQLNKLKGCVIGFDILVWKDYKDHSYYNNLPNVAGCTVWLRSEEIYIDDYMWRIRDYYNGEVLEQEISLDRITSIVIKTIATWTGEEQGTKYKGNIPGYPQCLNNKLYHYNI